MKRSIFGDPRPKGHSEIVEALDEKGMDPSDARARIEHGKDGFGGEGWAADVDAPVGEGTEEFGTLAYADKQNLISDLEAAGVLDIEED